MSKYGYYLGMTPEQQDIVKMVREFAERELDPVVKEYDEKGEYRAVHGIWDHSWVDALQVSIFHFLYLQSLGDFPLSVVLTAMHAALVQMNSVVSLQVWGNEDLLEAPLFSYPCIYLTK